MFDKLHNSGFAKQPLLWTVKPPLLTLFRRCFSLLMQMLFFTLSHYPTKFSQHSKMAKYTHIAHLEPLFNACVKIKKWSIQSYKEQNMLKLVCVKSKCSAFSHGVFL